MMGEEKMSEECEDKQRFDNFPIPIQVLMKRLSTLSEVRFLAFTPQWFSLWKGTEEGSVGKKSGYLIIFRNVFAVLCGHLRYFACVVVVVVVKPANKGS